jgi:tetratricopeptide (TPR) repeat protein
MPESCTFGARGRVRGHWVVLALGLLWLIPGPVGAAEDSPPEDVQARILELIEQLGDEEYSIRQQAQDELARLGLDAFDALYRAQRHEDIEIAMRAQYLVRTIQIQWTREEDPIEVKRVLRHYDEQGATERVSRMQRLSSLPQGQGTEALCRLVRFETSNVLSKRAALLILQQSPPEQAEGRITLARLIERSVGSSQRPAADWLRAYAEFLADPGASVDRWDELVRREEDVFRQSPDHTRHEVVRDLMRWQVEMLSRLGRDADAVAVMKRTVELRNGSREDLLELVDWLIARQAWVVIDEVAQKYQDQFDSDPSLLYRWAEAQRKQGDEERADETAQRASEREPEDRIVLALELQGRGLFDWSEREYRHLIQNKPEGSLLNIEARRRLAELLHDQEQDLQAAEMLQPAVHLIQTDAAVLGRLQERGPEGIVSRMHLFYALHFERIGQRDKQVEHLSLGIKSDPTDADVLIAMYRVPDQDATWQKDVELRIAEAAEKLRGTIGQLCQVLESLEQSEGGSEQQATLRRYLATTYNQLAWLISNTQGDFHEALRSSHESLKLRPGDAGLLDTLARCYYALGDYENAVKYQSSAAKLEPYSRQIARQLQQFEQALAQKKKDTPDP